MRKEKSMNTFIEIFISIFFVYGLYCAAYETFNLARRIYRYYRCKHKIDKEEKKDYNE